MKSIVIKRFIVLAVCISLCATLIPATAAVAYGATYAKIVSTTKNNKTYSLVNSYMKKWDENYAIGKSKIYAKYFEKSHPNAITLKWKLKNVRNNIALKKSTFYISTDKKMKKAKKYDVNGEQIIIDNLMAGTRYYWYVKGEFHGTMIKSPVYTFKTKWSPRTVRIDGISNARDIGGYKVPNGRVKQGMIYRSANLDQITKNGKNIVLKDLGIKTQLDLRRTNESYIGTPKSLGTTVKYINISGVGYEQLYNPKKDQKIIAREVAVFANKKNYPILFHCAIGRDRTGTLSFLMNGLLGVSKKNMFKDYEMSFFSVSGCYSYIETKKLVNRVKALYNHINKNYGNSKSTFAQKTELFLMARGVTKAQINNIRKIMIEKDKPAATVTTNVNTANKKLTASKKK